MSEEMVLRDMIFIIQYRHYFVQDMMMTIGMYQAVISVKLCVNSIVLSGCGHAYLCFKEKVLWWLTFLVSEGGSKSSQRLQN